jgi:hypothetical protein
MIFIIVVVIPMFFFAWYLVDEFNTKEYLKQKEKFKFIQTSKILKVEFTELKSKDILIEFYFEDESYNYGFVINHNQLLQVLNEIKTKQQKI